MLGTSEKLLEGILMPVSDPNSQRLRLLKQLLHLPAARLDEVERFLASLSTTQEVPRDARIAACAVNRDWAHSPLHRISEDMTYMVTSATLHAMHHFRGAERLDYLHAELLSQLKQGGWHLEAWAVFSNHYHFVAHAPRGSTLLPALLQELHRSTALHLNKLDQTPNRQVWFQYWESELTFETSYYARLKYVHLNPVKHGLVRVANQYRWCSANWFEQNATEAQVKTIYGMKIDRLKVEDDLEPV